MKIAVYSIALNEEKHAERWAKACAGADYLLVADTGSTDNTKSLLRDAGVTVHEITVKPWRFDTARNAALALLPADIDVCVAVDLDEVPEPQFFEKLRKQWDPKANRGWITMDTGHQWLSDRIHSRHGFTWIYPIHEVTAPNMGTEVVSCQIEATIFHKPDDSKPRTQYLPMLEQAVLENPSNARMRVYLIREYGFHKQWDKVIEEADKLRDLDPHDAWNVELSASWRNAGDACTHLGKRDEAEYWYEKSVEELPGEPEPYVALAQHFYFVQNWKESVRSAEIGLTQRQSTHYLNNKDSVWKLHDFISLCSWELGNVDKALRHAKTAYDLSKDQRIKQNIAFYEHQKTLRK